MKRWQAPSIAALLAAAPWLPSWADPVVVYRCTDAQGAVSLQDTPCPPRQIEQVRSLPRPAAAAATPASSLPAAAPEPVEPAPPEVRPRPRPRPLFLCGRPDGSQYESEDGVPERRWVPLWTLGLDPRAPARTFGDTGRSAPPPRSGPGIGSLPTDAALALGPGVWVEDRCVALSDAEACARRRATVAELARQERSQSRRLERDAIRARRQALRVQLAAECAG